MPKTEETVKETVGEKVVDSKEEKRKDSGTRCTSAWAYLGPAKWRQKRLSVAATSKGFIFTAAKSQPELPDVAAGTPLMNCGETGPRVRPRGRFHGQLMWP